MGFFEGMGVLVVIFIIALLFPRTFAVIAGLLFWLHIPEQNPTGVQVLLALLGVVLVIVAFISDIFTLNKILDS